VAYSGIGVFGIDHRVEHIEVSIYVFIFSRCRRSHIDGVHRQPAGKVLSG
jgi:hypothetical protein